jgi:hypothetical protein
MSRAVRWFLLFALVSTAMLASGQSAWSAESALIQDGIALSGSAGAPAEGAAIDAELAPAPTAIAGTTSINFDDVAAPCSFIETTALRDAYAAYGVWFEGAAALDGGAILNECGNFGVSGHSSPNFLAVNAGAQLSDGGIPQDPEYLYFTPAVSQVTAKFGSNSGAGYTLTMSAYDSAWNLVAQNALVLSPTMTALSVSAASIWAVVIDSPAAVWVMDDLSFTSAAPYIEDMWTSDSTSDPAARKTAFVAGETIVFWTRLRNHPGGQLYQDLGFYVNNRLVRALRNLDYGDVGAGDWDLVCWATAPSVNQMFRWGNRVRGPGYTIQHTGRDHTFSIHR